MHNWISAEKRSSKWNNEGPSRRTKRVVSYLFYFGTTFSWPPGGVDFSNGFFFFNAIYFKRKSTKCRSTSHGKRLLCCACKCGSEVWVQHTNLLCALCNKCPFGTETSIYGDHLLLFNWLFCNKIIKLKNVWK